MSSKDGDALKNELLHLIYKHLSENGYQKAAKEVKKHVAQKGIPALTASLQDIYTSWTKAPENTKKRKSQTDGDDSATKKSRLSDPVSSTESSEEDDTEKAPAPAPVPPASYICSSEESSSEESDLEEEPQKLPQKAVGTPVVNQQKNALRKVSSPAPGRPSKQTASPARAAPVLQMTAESPARDSDSSSGSENEAPAQKAAVPATPAKSASGQAGPGKASAPAPVKASQAKDAPVAEAESSDSDSDSSESKDEAPAQKIGVTPCKVSTPAPVKPSQATPSQAKATAKTPVVQKMAESSESDTDSSSESEEEAPAQKNVGTPKATSVSGAPLKSASIKTGPGTVSAPAPSKHSQVTATPVVSKTDSSETGSSSDSEEEVAPTQQKAAFPRKALNVKTGSAEMSSPAPVRPSQVKDTPVAEKAESSESDSDSSESADETPAEKSSVVSKAKPVSATPVTPGVKPGLAKVSTPAPVKPTLPSPSQAKAKAKAPVAQKTAEISESDSASSSDSEGESLAAKTQQKPDVKSTPAKPSTVKPAAATPAPGALETDSNSSEGEDEMPLKTLKQTPQLKASTAARKSSLKAPNKSTKSAAVKAAPGKVSTPASTMTATATQPKPATEPAVGKKPGPSGSKSKGPSKSKDALKTPQKSEATPKQLAVSSGPPEASSETDSSASEDEHEVSQSLLAPTAKATKGLQKSTPAKPPSALKGGQKKKLLPAKAKTPTQPAAAPAKGKDCDSGSSTDLSTAAPALAHPAPKGKWQGLASGSSSEDSSEDEISQSLLGKSVTQLPQQSIPPKSRSMPVKEKQKKTATPAKGKKKSAPQPAESPEKSDSDSEIDVEKWKRLARAYATSFYVNDVSELETTPEPAITGITLSAKKASKKEKSKAVSKSTVNSNGKTSTKNTKPSASRTKKTGSALTVKELLSIMDKLSSSSSEGEAEDAQATSAQKGTARKRSLPSVPFVKASSEEEGKKSKNGKATPSAETKTAVGDVTEKKRRKKDQKETARVGKKLKTSSEDGKQEIPTITISGPSLVKKKTDKNKHKLKDKKKKIKKTPFRPSQGLPFDMPTSLGTSPALAQAAAGKKRTSSKGK